MPGIQPRAVTYSTHEVARISGLTPRQLQHADERGYLRPANRIDGFRQFRRYTEQQALAACFLARLIECGIGHQRRRELLSATSPELLDRAAALAATVRGPVRVFAASEDYLTIVRDPVIVLSVEACRRRMRNAAAA